MKISIIITAYNVKDYIEKAIESAINQTYKDIEIIVVNDCSTDNTKQLIEKYDVKLINNKENVGAGLSRRIGIKYATGDYILLLDADDWLNEDCIETLVKNINNSDIVTCWVAIWNEYRIIETYKYKNEILADNRKYMQREDIKFLNNCLVNRKLYDKVEYSDSRYIEDVPTKFKLVYFANQVNSIEYVGYNYYQRYNSLCHTADKLKTTIYTLMSLIDLFYFFKEHDQKLIKELDIASSIFFYCINLDTTHQKYEKQYKIIKTFIKNEFKIY